MERKKIPIKTIIITIIQVIIIIGTILFTISAINLAELERGYVAYGGEYLIPLLGAIVIIIINKFKK